jgi:hypothetical protein
MTSDKDSTEVIAGQIWRPDASSRAQPRRVVWTGRDDCYGHGAVRWCRADDLPPFRNASTMQGKTFRWWIRKHGAKTV